MLTARGLDCLADYLEDSNILSCLLVNLDPSLNDPELPHSINGALLHRKLYLELVIVNNLFKDFFTPFAVLVGRYL